jgi:hypothetical protein
MHAGTVLHNIMPRTNADDLVQEFLDGLASDDHQVLKIRDKEVLVRTLVTMCHTLLDTKDIKDRTHVTNEVYNWVFMKSSHKVYSLDCDF